jgi:murein DD-endopeptidase MepM/ murein hydrolase activator NlpD
MDNMEYSNMKLHSVRRILCISVLFFVVVLAAVPASGAVNSSELQQQINKEERAMDRLENQVEQHRKAISKVKAREKGVLEELTTYDQKKQLAEQKITVLNLKEKKVKNTISELQQQIRSSEQDLAEMKGIFRERLISIYKYGNNAGLQLLISAPSAHEALTTSFLLSKIARQDQEMIETVNRKMEELESACSSLEEQEQLLARQKDELQNAREQYEKESRQRDSLLSKLQKEKELHFKAARELERSQKEIQSKINSMIRKKKELEAQRQKNASPGSYKVVTYMKPGARLSWPLRGAVTSEYGTRVHPIFKTKSRHTGIDINGNKGDPVRSAQDGQVLFSGWLRGYGQVIIIDHGNSLTTVYAHLSSALVRENQSIKMGQVIGRVGNTGVATGSHLHFEVRVNGDARNPRNYL